MSAPREKFLVYNNNQIDHGKIRCHKKPTTAQQQDAIPHPLGNPKVFKPYFSIFVSAFTRVLGGYIILVLDQAFNTRRTIEPVLTLGFTPLYNL
jgi:hypothetical protein